MKKLILASILAIALAVGAAHAADFVPSTIDQPGTQPGEIGALSGPDRCDNCHGGYNTAVEPAFNWRGSMMANAGRDPIFWATVAVVEQDFYPKDLVFGQEGGAGDLCIRCHSTAGWLAGRSTPTDGSGLGQSDSDGVECDFCHKMTNPDNLDPSVPPDPPLIGVMNQPFTANNEGDPGWTSQDPIIGYYGSGMFSMWGGNDMLGPYAVTNAKHQFQKSKFHRDREFCGTCHDVSNPAVGNLAHNFGAQKAFLAAFPEPTADGSTEPPDGKVHDSKAAFNNFPYQYGIVERTFSEHMSSLVPFTKVDDFPTLPADLQGGALQAMYNAAFRLRWDGTLTADYEDFDPRYYTCQTCHLRPVTGQGCNKNPEVRDDLPLHDMTGGNYWIPEAIKYLDSQGKLLLGGNLTATQIAALDAGALRAKEQLDLAASLSVQGKTVKIVNHTGHKLISGYPEGRRMWLRIKWYDGSSTVPIRVDGEYGRIMVTVDLNNDGTAEQVEVDTILDLYDPNTKIYEAHYGMTREWAQQLIGLGYDENLLLSIDRYDPDLNKPDKIVTLLELAAQDPGTYHETFHFALNNYVAKDNRIPPYGMSYDKALARNALPVPENQYGGGPGKTYDYFDTFHLNPPQGAASAIIDLLYQPTSYEYQLFLLKANPPDPLNPDFLDMEGQYMFEAWRNTGMAAPYVMASATWHDPTVPQCTAPVMVSAVPSSQQVDLTWEAVALQPDTVQGYRLYYDQAGKAQLVADVGQDTTTYTDTGLTNGQEYCYKVTYWYDVDGDGLFDSVNDCESAFSNIVCATSDAPGQTVLAGVTGIETWGWVTTGKGRNQTTSFEQLSTFNAGDDVVILVYVVDVALGTPLSNATVDLEITGTSLTFTEVPTNVDGVAEVVWQTQKKTAAGSYDAQVTNVIPPTGYSWDFVTPKTTFTIK